MAYSATTVRVVRTRRSFHPVRLLLHLWGVRRQRLALSRLDPHLLDDIGVSRDDADDEAGRPFWDAPATWRL
ncbi:MAG: DUF1127 domain-containing protein [Tranquillimonas sp.]|jgi:uncharacterized protein YjiS (DUF1127 family)